MSLSAVCFSLLIIGCEPRKEASPPPVVIEPWPDQKPVATLEIQQPEPTVIYTESELKRIAEVKVWLDNDDLFRMPEDDLEFLLTPAGATLLPIVEQMFAKSATAYRERVEFNVEQIRKQANPKFGVSAGPWHQWRDALRVHHAFNLSGAQAIALKINSPLANSYVFAMSKLDKGELSDSMISRIRDELPLLRPRLVGYLKTNKPHLLRAE